MATFAQQGFDRPNIWIACRPCRRGIFLFATHPMIADRKSDQVRFRCQDCGRLTHASYMDPRGYDPAGWTVLDMNGPEPVPSPLLTDIETGLACRNVPIRRPRKQKKRPPLAGAFTGT